MTRLFSRVFLKSDYNISICLFFKTSLEDYLMTEDEKRKLGYLYDANFDVSLLKERDKCQDKIFELNNVPNSNREKRYEIMKSFLGKCDSTTTILSPFSCDYGKNIKVGKYFFMNYGGVILDGNDVIIGDYVFIAPNCVISCAGHALDKEQRNKGLEIARKIVIGDNVWIGANVTILPGVTIGNDSVIGACSVVTKDIPTGVIAFGNPCKVIRKITEEDKNKYPKAE